jgi:ribosome-binding factor A
MSNRTIRINELVQRELSDILRKRYQAETVSMTITEVRVAPDLRDARVFVSIVGSDDEIEKKLWWLRKQASDIRKEVGKRIVLKYLPKFEYRLDTTTPKSARLLAMMDDLKIPVDEREIQPPSAPLKRPSAE